MRGEAGIFAPAPSPRSKDNPQGGDDIKASSHPLSIAGNVLSHWILDPIGHMQLREAQGAPAWPVCAQALRELRRKPVGRSADGDERLARRGYEGRHAAPRPS